ncbi:Protein-tyrosine sulfotransferase [Nymphaea thermarum]|nr:Protein-tyrosine sulfotransferase [Nymphaea thermarum]
MARLELESSFMREMLGIIKAWNNQSMISEEIDPYNVAGLTEGSCLQESHAIRRCIRMHPSLGNYVLDVAKKRLDKMFFVGLTEKHKESMEMFAHSIEAELQALSTAPQANDVAVSNTEINSYLLMLRMKSYFSNRGWREVEHRAVLEPQWEVEHLPTRRCECRAISKIHECADTAMY